MIRAALAGDHWVATLVPASGKVIRVRAKSKREALAALDDTRPRLAEIAAAAYGLTIHDGGPSLAGALAVHDFAGHFSRP